MAKALDKLEAQIQHNEACISTWIEIERDLIHALEPHARFDSFLDRVRAAVVDEAKRKIAASAAAIDLGH